MNGNWSQLDVTSLGVRSATALLALTGFWAAVTAGRVLVAAIQRWLPSRAAYHGLPFLLAARIRVDRGPAEERAAAAVAAFSLRGTGLLGVAAASRSASGSGNWRAARRW